MYLLSGVDSEWALQLNAKDLRRIVLALNFTADEYATAGEPAHAAARRMLADRIADQLHPFAEPSACQDSSLAAFGEANLEPSRR
jgi:hypothetical protein